MEIHFIILLPYLERKELFMKKLSKKSAALLVAGLVTCGLLAGCGGGDKAPAKDGGKAAAKTLTFGCQMYSDGLINPAS